MTTFKAHGDGDGSTPGAPDDRRSHGQAHPRRDPRDPRRRPAPAAVHRLRRQRGRAARRAARPRPDDARAARPTSPPRRGDLGPGPRLRRRRPRDPRRAPGRPVRAAQGARRRAGVHGCRRRARWPRSCAPSASSTCARSRRRRRRRRPAGVAIAEGLRHSKSRDAEAIHHHYDVSNTFYEWVLGPSMTYTCACYPRRRRIARGGAGEQVPAGLRQAAAAARRPAARRRLRLGRHGALRRAPRRPGHSASRCRAEQAAWAQQAIADEGLQRPRRGAATATTATSPRPASTRCPRSG